MNDSTYVFDARAARRAFENHAAATAPICQPNAKEM
jgi:hypothetical protein